tara:strand:- start:18060 stop:18584 length:525 start_codon:yes stop_codon:yes gene_type:complete
MTNENTYVLRLIIFLAFLYSSQSISQILSESIGYAYSMETEEYALNLQNSEDSIPALGRYLGLKINRLEIEPNQIELEINQSFELSMLKVMAFDSSNSLINEVLLDIELEAPNNLIEIVESPIGSSATLKANNTGVGRLWISSLSPSSKGENYTIPLIIVVNSNKELPQPPLLY